MDDLIIYILIFSIAVFAYYIFRIEPRLIKTERCVLYHGEDPLVLLQLSDLHLNDLKVRIDDINSIIAKEAPDLIAITGDMLDKEKDLVYLDNFLTSLSYPCPVYMVLGNHDAQVISTQKDIDGFKLLLQKFPNITLLNNEAALFVKDSRSFDIIGIADTQSDLYSPDTVSLLIKASNNTKIVLTHNPDAASDISPNSCHCIIAGHLHGGQIWLPFNFEFKILRKDRLPKKGYKQGLYLINGNRLYISRGIGTSLIPARFLSRPEITVFIL
jgi:uncharacterized protein